MRENVVSEPIRVDEWLKALEELSARSVEGFTTAELAAALRLSNKTTREKMKALMVAGRLRHVGSRPEPSMVGKMTYRPVYQLVKG